MKKILIIIITLFVIASVSCSSDKDEPNVLSTETLYGTWSVDKITLISHETGNSYNEELDDVDAATKMVITPETIYFFWLGNVNYYETGLFGWNYINGHIYGTYMDYSSERWHNYIITHRSYVFDVEVLSSKIVNVKLQLQNDDNKPTDFYRVYTFVKNNNKYNYW